MPRYPTHTCVCTYTNPPHPQPCPHAEGIEIKITDELVSQPYVDMTVKLMERFGVKVRRYEAVRWAGACLGCHSCGAAGSSAQDCERAHGRRHTEPLRQPTRPGAAAEQPAPAAALPAREQVNKLDGLQHMHIPAGQTYQSPGMAYVEGDASSGQCPGLRPARRARHEPVLWEAPWTAARAAVSP